MKKLWLFLSGFMTNSNKQFSKLNSHYSAQHYNLVRHPDIHQTIFPDLPVILLFNKGNEFVFLSHKNELLLVEKHTGKFEIFIVFCETLTEESLACFCEEHHQVFDFKETQPFVDFINQKLNVPQLKVVQAGR